MHAQRRNRRQSEVEARREHGASIRDSVGAAASAVLSGDYSKAEVSLGQAQHAAQDEKHEFGQFSVHTGNPRNDYRTAEGAWQLSTDVTPTTVQQHQAAQRTLEVLKDFENKIREAGKKQGLSKDEIDKKIKDFKERQEPGGSEQSTSDQKEQQQQL